MAHSAVDMGTLLLSFYVITLLCLWTIPMTATLGVYLLATRGTAHSHFLCHRANREQVCESRAATRRARTPFPT